MKSKVWRWVKTISKALLRTGLDIGLDTFGSVIQPRVQNNLHAMLLPKYPRSRLYTSRWYPTRSVDGATLNEFTPNPAFAKYAIPKGLPISGKRALAIENDPHFITDFSGEIEEGYGKGIKTLLLSKVGIVKIGERTFPAKINYHSHNAIRAGLHYDLVVEGVPPGTEQWELNIPSGEFKGRYAFVTTPKGKLIVPMKDEGMVIPKPAYRTKLRNWLKTVNPDEYVFEQKYDGSLSNVLIMDNYATFRSHREEGETYYDRLPQLEHISNTSNLWSSRKLFRGPNLRGSLVRGELVHPDGPGRIGGILNAYPEKARQIQALRGEATFVAWDILKYRGRDVSKLPYGERRALLKDTIAEVRIFNKHWYVSAEKGRYQSPEEFYDMVIAQPMPYGEGIVAKSVDSKVGEGNWFKVKNTDPFDLPVVEILEGSGKYSGSVGRMVVENPANGARGEIGSFSITDEKRQWIWDHRDQLIGAVAKIKAQNLTDRQVPRAGVFLDFHPDKGNTEAAMLMYTESLAGGDSAEAKNILFALKSAKGWHRAS